MSPLYNLKWFIRETHLFLHRPRVDTRFSSAGLVVEACPCRSTLSFASGTHGVDYTFLSFSIQRPKTAEFAQSLVVKASVLALHYVEAKMRLRLGRTIRLRGFWRPAICSIRAACTDEPCARPRPQDGFACTKGVTILRCS